MKKIFRRILLCVCLAACFCLTACAQLDWTFFEPLQSSPSVSQSVPSDSTDGTDETGSTDSTDSTDSSIQDEDEDGRIRYAVSFEKNNGEAVYSYMAYAGDAVVRPADPERENYIFRRWCSDASLTQEFDFTQKVEGPTALYAEYILDGVKLTNTITTQTVHSVVTVYSVYKKVNIMGQTTEQSTSQGSGVIYKEDGTYYYLLTNNHVVYAISGYSKQEITVIDYSGKEYSATIYNSAIDPDYDLACLRISKGDGTLCVSELATANPQTEQDVIAVTTPKGQRNAISYGKLNQYRTVSMQDPDPASSNVSFPVIEHTAFIDHGSSGGALFDASLRIIGINYAGTSESGRNYAIPPEKVREFLTSYSVA